MLSNFMSSFKLTSYDKTAMKYFNKFFNYTTYNNRGELVCGL